MAESGASPSPRSFPTLIFSLFGAALVAAAGMMMFSAFMFYDDEGYVLNSLRNFALHGKLYGEVYSQYGPFPYVAYYALHLVGLPFTHTAGRIITLMAWSGAAFAAAGIVWRDTRSQTVRLAVLAAVFVYLWIMVSEPTHPGGLIALTTGLMAYAGHRWILTGSIDRWARVAGVGAAILLLTKVNVGGFATLSAVAWFLIHHQQATVRRYAPILIVIGVVLLPFALMRSLLDAAWVQTYAIMFACSGVAAVGAISLGKHSRANWNALGIGVKWAVGTGLVVLGVVLLRGTSLSDVIEGVLLRPLRHPVRFNLGFSWPAGVQVGSVLSLGLFIAARFGRRKGISRVDELVAASRLLGAVLLALLIAQFPRISPDNLLLAFAVPWLWVYLWPLPGESPAHIAARSWVGLLFLGQCLHGFPVRGSQTAWGTFLLLPLVAIGAWQAARWLLARDFHLLTRHRAMAAGFSLLVGGFAVTTGWRLIQVGNRYYDGRSLDLPGAEPLRLPENATALFRLLTINAAAHGDMLFSLPGMFSFNLWSDRPTPTLANVTHWFSLLEPEQQRATIQALEKHPRACIIIHREHVSFITKRGFAPAGLLNDYISEHYVPAFTLDDFEFCVRKGRKILPLLLGEMFIRSKELATDPSTPNDTMLKFAMSLPPDVQIASIELVVMNAPQIPPLVLSAANARVEIVPTELSGEAIGSPQARRWPLSLQSTAVVSVFFDRKHLPFAPKETLVVLRDSAGVERGLVRLQP